MMSVNRAALAVGVLLTVRAGAKTPALSTVAAHLPGFSTVTGVLAVPELHRVFASVAGHHEVAVVDTESLKVLARPK